MLDQTDGYTTADGRKIGGVVMEMKNITLRFGGVTAIEDISFDIREGEIRAIIGPNGAGKSSMLNIISGFYTPTLGELWYKGAKRPLMRPFEVARMGIARTFQNIALFEHRHFTRGKESVPVQCRAGLAHVLGHLRQRRRGQTQRRENLHRIARLDPVKALIVVRRIINPLDSIVHQVFTKFGPADP